MWWFQLSGRLCIIPLETTNKNNHTAFWLILNSITFAAMPIHGHCPCHINHKINKYKSGPLLPWQHHDNMRVVFKIFILFFKVLLNLLANCESVFRFIRDVYLITASNHKTIWKLIIFSSCLTLDNVTLAGHKSTTCLCSLWAASCIIRFSNSVFLQNNKQWFICSVRSSRALTQTHRVILMLRVLMKYQNHSTGIPHFPALTPTSLHCFVWICALLASVSSSHMGTLLSQRRKATVTESLSPPESTRLEKIPWKGFLFYSTNFDDNLNFSDKGLRSKFLWKTYGGPHCFPR